MPLTINVSDDLRAHLERQLADGGFRSIDEYVEILIRRDRQHSEDQETYYARLLAIGQETGEITDDDHRRVQDEINAPRLEALRKSLREADAALDRGEGYVYDSAEGLLADIKQLAAERNQTRRTGTTG
ncbi:MAG TPA: hypothetical protein VK986_11625 [Tepidisphaeraceae bacterium]|nr:hypothetical protein [Tepidisphaeraceae bacterium]